MARREYDWTSIDTPPLIGRHSLNKHEVLDNYLARYLDKLYSGAREYLRVSFIDGFAGGGIYLRPDTKAHHFGSPVRIVHAVENAQSILPDKYQKNVIIKPRYYFVEKHPKYFSVLKHVLQSHDIAVASDGKGGCFQGKFETRLPAILDSIQSEGRKHEALFVLDQYGYTDVPVQTIQHIFTTLPDAEVILTFAVDWLIDYLSDKPAYLERSEKRLQALGIEIPLRDILALKGSTPYARLLIQDILSEELSRNCGARFFTRYFIQTEGLDGSVSHRSIWLVHMSQHQIARDEMVSVHWESASHLSTHAGFQGIDESGLRGLGYSTKLDDRLGQLNLDYNFDSLSQQSSVDILLRQLPEIIWQKQPLSFAELMGLVANATPVSSDIVRQVLDIILASRDIEVYSTNMRKRQKGNAIHWTVANRRPREQHQTR